MFVGLVELNVWITFLCQVQVDYVGSDVSEVIVVIKCQLVFVFMFEFFEFFCVCIFYLVGSGNVD